jgi:hypothetical protein
MDTPDPQQQLSIELLEQHREALVADAREILAEQPDAKLVGMILAPDSSEAENFRAALQRAGQPPAGEVGIVCVDWLESDPSKLPLFAAMKDGMRLGWASLEDL